MVARAQKVGYERTEKGGVLAKTSAATPLTGSESFLGIPIFSIKQPRNSHINR